MLPTKFLFIWLSRFKGEDFFYEIHRNDHLNLHYVGTMLIQVSYVTLIPTGNLIS